MSTRRIFFVVLSLLTGPACGQPALTLRDAIVQAISVSPQLKAGTGRILSSEGHRTQAGLSPNPRFFFQSENARLWETPRFRYWQSTDNYAFLSQVFETAGKRERRVDLADAGVRLAELDQRLLARQIAGRVASAYWTAVATSQVKSLLTQNVTNFERIVQYHRDRVREGAMAEADLIRIELESERLKLSSQTAEQEASRAVIALAREMGRSDFTSVEPTEPLDVLRTIDRPDIASAINSRPEMQVARQAVEQAKANLRLQQANAKPDPDLLFGYKRTAGLDTLFGGVQINLPFRNRNQGSISAAEADIRVAQSNLAAAETMLRAELTSAWNDYEARQKTVTGILRPMRAHAGETSRIAEAAYREGGADLLRLLDAERARIESEILYYRTLADYQQSVTALEIFLGLLP